MNASGRRLLADSRYSPRFAKSAIMFSHIMIIITVWYNKISATILER